MPVVVVVASLASKELVSLKFSVINIQQIEIENSSVLLGMWQGPPRRLNKYSAVAEMGDRLATIDMGRKVEGCCDLFWGDKRRSEAEATARHKH